jgi:hypothetical protein
MTTKARDDWIEDARGGGFEADFEDSIEALFRRHPALCGFAVGDTVAEALAVTEVSVDPMRFLERPDELGLHIALTLAALIAEDPQACELMRERTFARVFH